MKMDLKDAYRLIPVHPDDQHLLAISWAGRTYVDRCLPFGLQSAPKIFTAVADAMAWALFRGGIAYVLHYLDDFLFVCPPGSSEARHMRDLATTIFADLGAPISAHKTEGPSAQITFLGFLIDTDEFQLRLPEDKLARLRELINAWQRRKSCTRREMESLLGHLCHAATAIRPGRLFLRPLFNLLPHAPEPYHFIRLSLAIRADLHWWAFLLREWNGVSLFPLESPSVHIFSDASGSYGCGAVAPTYGWFNLRWPQEWASVDIAVKELIPVVMAAGLWGPVWAGHHVQFHTDNMAVVAVIQNLNAKDTRLGHLLRCLYFYAAYYCFNFSAAHIPGIQNTAADALSRGDLSRFHSLFPQVREHTVPPELVSPLLQPAPDWNSHVWMAQWRASFHPVSTPSTAMAYRSGVSRFLAFCHLAGLHPFPLTEQSLCRFVAHLYDDRLTLSSIRLYLSALCFWQICQGGSDLSLDSHARLHYVLRGITRSQPRAARPPRLPVSLDILDRLFRVWSASPSRHETTMLWAACTLGFFAFLRSGEFTVVPNGSGMQLTPSDIRVDDRGNLSYLAVTLRGSKTDPFGAGCTLFVGRSNSHVCAVTAVLAYLAIRPPSAGPLFLHTDGSPLTRSDLVAAMRTALIGSGLDITRYSTHSFRIGAATAAANAGLPDSLIQTLGRWRSSPFLRYIRTPQSTLLSVPRTLVQGNVPALQPRAIRRSVPWPFVREGGETSTPRPRSS